ncbi:hypothetical protein K435DRAFT_248533, partial [Dendrothele bispora CBS 962.96]
LGGEYGNALQAASSQGHESVVRLLLERGADVNVQGGKYGYALQAASSQGHESIVKLLLERGADVNIPGGKYGNALQAARFHQKIEQLILDWGAEVSDACITVDELDDIGLYIGQADDHLHGINTNQHRVGRGNNKPEGSKKQVGKTKHEYDENHQENNSSRGGDELKMTTTNISNTTDDPIPQDTPQTSFEELHYGGAKNQSSFHHSSGDSREREDTEQDNQEISNNENPARDFHNINGEYTEQDNRRIEHNIEHAETYYEGGNTVNNNVEGNLKAVFVGGALAGGGFYLGQTTAQVEGSNYHYNRSQPALLGNKALVIY